MSPPARDIANAAQRRASDPGVSAFVSASAGSGKTKLLTDRLLRLMLAGSDPARILCLTFTKAAAAEMALRLQRRLGAWVTMDDAALDVALQDIAVVADAAGRATARSLFARVLDLPGGMRIGTIHAFCQSLLRRFPLEAQLSPHFDLADERDSAIAWQQARETMLEAAHSDPRRDALERLAGLVGLADFGALVETLQRDRTRLEAAAALGSEALLAALRRVLGATPKGTLLHDAVSENEPEMRRLFTDIAQRSSAASAEKAGRIVEWLSLGADDRFEHWARWREEFLTKTGDPRGLGAFVPKARVGLFAGLEEIVEAEQARILRIQDGWAAFEVAELSQALLSLAVPVTEAYAAAKSVTARLDYDDLIARTARLLVTPGAAWVLYKLDGGLDHLLLDEVQDTAPAQWEIAGSLTAEFFAGDGARPGLARTVFAVGDRKQSIYGFQGADPAAFGLWRDRLRTRVRDAGQTWEDVPLEVSFRSTPPVLALVDAVFAGGDAARGVADGAPLQHVADRAGQAGRCEIWPVTPRPDAAPIDPWTIPTENRRQASAMQRLADSLAEWIADRIARGDRLDSRDRAVGAGDFLVLVRRRNAFPATLMRALKSRGVAVAGLDRMVLAQQPAVADLVSLCECLLLPEDDLTLACVLTSPLGGLTDDQLMALAAPRRTSLWAALLADDAPHCRAAAVFIGRLRARVDHASPHALLSEALGPLGGRARLLARLGPEAAEPVDELLAASLRHAQTHPASLQSFLHWLSQSAQEVKREPDGPAGEGHDAVRIMTVHGAKGLQAPIVILPDTTGRPPDDERVLWAFDPDSNAALHLPVWTPRRELRCDAAKALRATASEAQSEEQNRLLYVALTRAEDQLLVCGWQIGRGDIAGDSWYAHVERGFLALDAEASAFAAVATPWAGESRVVASAQVVPARTSRPAAVAEVAELPGWAGRAPDWLAAPPPAEPALPQPLAPSRPDGVTLGDRPLASSPLAARDFGGRHFRRGQLVHSLLQHLPALDPEARLAAAIRFAARPAHDIDDPESLAREVLAVLEHPALAVLFGPHGRAEVPLSGLVAHAPDGQGGGGQVVGGLIDRMAVLADRVVMADYKTNRRPPDTVADTPVLYLRQMAAYRAILHRIFPDRPVECLLVWTVGCRITKLPDALLDSHAPAAMVDA